jgi:phosphoribosylaminoimidazole-succinocarboxamide synthase
MGKAGQQVPEMSDEWIQTISNRYIELYEKVIGEEFTALSFNEDETFFLIMESLNKLKIQRH